MKCISTEMKYSDNKQNDQVGARLTFWGICRL